MVIGIEPLEKSLKTIKNPGHIICLTPQGKVLIKLKLSSFQNLRMLLLCVVDMKVLIRDL